MSSLSQMYKIASDEEEQAMQKYLKLSTKPEYDEQRNELNEQVFIFRKKFHQVIIIFFLNLKFI